METLNAYTKLLENIKADAAEIWTDAEQDIDTAIDLCYQYADSSEYVIYYRKAKELCQLVLDYDSDVYDNAECDMFEILVADSKTTMDQLHSFIAYHIIRDLAIEAVQAMEEETV